jgi:hypothetical protein
MADDELTVQDGALADLLEEAVNDLREVAGERALLAGLQVRLIAGTERQAAMS